MVRPAGPYARGVSERVVSVNVGEPREVEWRGQPVRTAIFKTPVEGPVAVSRLNLAGDRQADLESHGGVNKAVYGYPSEHYPFWRDAYPELDGGPGLLGENLTLAGLLEDEVRVGDVFRVGSAELAAAQPRMPCFKLGIRLGHPGAVKRFQQSGRPGIYFRVVREGVLEAGSAVERIESAKDAPTILDVVELYRAARPDRVRLERAVRLESLGPEWRDAFRRALAGGRA